MRILKADLLSFQKRYCYNRKRVEEEEELPLVEFYKRFIKRMKKQKKRERYESALEKEECNLFSQSIVHMTMYLE